MTGTCSTPTGGRREIRRTTVSARRETSAAPASDATEIRFRRVHGARGTLATECRGWTSREGPAVPTRTTVTNLSARTGTRALISARALRRGTTCKKLSPTDGNLVAIPLSERRSFRSTVKAAVTDTPLLLLLLLLFLLLQLCSFQQQLTSLDKQQEVSQNLLQGMQRETLCSVPPPCTEWSLTCKLRTDALGKPASPANPVAGHQEGVAAAFLASVAKGWRPTRTC